MARKTTDMVPIMLRLREKLRRRIEEAAKKNNQSMNTEIIERLEQSFERHDLATTLKNVIRTELFYVGRNERGAEKKELGKGEDEIGTRQREDKG